MDPILCSDSEGNVFLKFILSLTYFLFIKAVYPEIYVRLASLVCLIFALFGFDVYLVRFLFGVKPDNGISFSDIQMWIAGFVWHLKVARRSFPGLWRSLADCVDTEPVIEKHYRWHFSEQYSYIITNDSTMLLHTETMMSMDTIYP